ncbi:hypothetical protein CYLTODRAFT_417679 [Cylindrobasidium torrendii FP15055 ss-10]|uniref:Uncharacterized protein n=1 Tax=Cylindrobasidium torrendii FP15055 ss-10 TaxID=1314674 RepID=A0A0D7BQH3_9AGAR|nr:hypothetical protein CYLTODRAFT_417679 [Cylindrobasidium torrendii FP15055 ss-10]
MFGESESESPRVPSPWDSLISIPTTLGSSPLSCPSLSPSPPLVPRLVPEADDGNIEYKLQLLDPTPARFARLVTQLKWRLLEGGGQAYYELGVADSGALIGLRRNELEQTLETLDTMAGEIGASVVVVKEIEVPPALINMALSGGSERRKGEYSTSEDDTTTEDEEAVSPAIFAIELDADESTSPSPEPEFSFDLEIATVFKPRPLRVRSAPAAPPAPTDKKAKKKLLAHLHGAGGADKEKLTKGEKRRQARDKRREERRRALEIHMDAHLEALPANEAGHVEQDLVDALGELHVANTLERSPVTPTIGAPVEQQKEHTIPSISLPEDDDVFPTPRPAQDAANEDGCRLIVEALVVRKMSIEEAYLDFGFEGFAV